MASSSSMSSNTLQSPRRPLGEHHVESPYAELAQRRDQLRVVAHKEEVRGVGRLRLRPSPERLEY